MPDEPDVPRSSDLVPAERVRLAELEIVIEQGFETFVEVGQALAEIRDSRLYRETHRTFEDYCRERWVMRRQNVDRLIRSMRVAELLNPMGFTPNERQARALVPLLGEPQELRRVWADVRASGEPTAAAIDEAVKRRLWIVRPPEEPIVERLRSQTTCPTCRGTGLVPVEDPEDEPSG